LGQLYVGMVWDIFILKFYPNNYFWLLFVLGLKQKKLIFGWFGNYNTYVSNIHIILLNYSPDSYLNQL